MFRQDFTCPALLKDLTALRIRGCHPLWPAFPDRSASSRKTTGLFRFRSPLLTESLLMSVPPGTEMFQFPGFASPHYVFMQRYPKGVGCPIRISTDQSLLAAPRGFSQRATSFIASWCQGIHRMPLSRSNIFPPCAGTIHSSRFSPLGENPVLGLTRFSPLGENPVPALGITRKPQAASRHPRRSCPRTRHLPQRSEKTAWKTPSHTSRL